MRIREDERAAVAAHLHDSVLQSLVLMQRSDDPRRMASLARRQERELRAWLYGTHARRRARRRCTPRSRRWRSRSRPTTTCGSRRSSSAISHSTTRRGRSSAAIREALVNAARHADVDQVDVFVEADDTELTGFVRDTGCGFDPHADPGRPARHQRLDRRPGPARRRHGRAHVDARRRHRGRAARAAEPGR